MIAENRLGRYIPIHYHYQMLLDEARMRGFRAAIEYAVPPGGRVLELGGGTGVLSCFAAQKAEQVWCVEKQADLAEKARAFLTMNPGGEKVEVITGAAEEFLPPEPVDVVICEMLHSALLREKQVEVIADFKRRYLDRFETLPRFIPEATVLFAEAVHRDYEFFGYRADVPIFEDPVNPFEGTRSLGEPVNYALLDYGAGLPARLSFRGVLPVTESGTCNALRFRTNNILAVMTETGDFTGWMNQHLIIPLGKEIAVAAGNTLNASFQYQPGDELESLMESLVVY